MSEKSPAEKIPVTVLTGYLGAGKTTRLNRWLKHPALADTLIVINEFGEIGLDHLLVEEAPGDVVLLAAGCLCCSIRGDLVATAKVVSGGKIRIELTLDGELAKHLRSQSCAANRAKLRGRQRPRSD